MKIRPFTIPRTSELTFSSYQEDIEKLSGRDISNKYKKYFLEKEENIQKQQTQLALDILPAIQAFSDKGLYNSSILLFNEVKSILNEDNLNTTAYISAGNSYKNLGNLKQANHLYQFARKNIPYIDGMNAANAYKNYLISSLMLGEKINNEKDLSENNIFSNIANYQVEAAKAVLKENPDVNNAAKNILQAYSATKQLGIIDNDIYYNTALIYNSAGDFDKSAKLCKINLDILQKENKVYTKEFIDNITLLGEIYLKSAKTLPDINLATNVLQNARDISIKSGLKQNIQYINYLLLQTKLETADTDEYLAHFNKLKNDLETNRDNNAMLKSILVFTAKNQRLDIDKKQRVEYLKEAEKIVLNEPEINEAELFNIYYLIKEIDPDLTDEYISKINNLNSPDIKDIKTLTALLEINYKNKDLEKIKSFSKLQSKNSLPSYLCDAYKYLLNINEDKNFEDNLLNLERSLFNIEYNNKKTNDPDINNALYRLYTKIAAILYSAQEYYKAALYSDKLVKTSQSLQLNNNDIAKNHIQNVLINYKAKNYYRAENSCLKYLSFLLKNSTNQELQTKDLTISDLRYMSENDLTSGNTENQKRNIASAIETLGLINMKKGTYNDAETLYRLGIKIREKIKDKDLNLANDYAAIARILIVLGIGGGISNSKSWHEKCIEALKNLSKSSVTDQILQEEEVFHKKYYGWSLTSVSKFTPLRNKSHIIENFKCYNKELNICE